MDQTNVQLDGTNVARKNEHSLFGKKVNKGAWRAFLSNLSQGLTVPIAVMPIAGLCLGVGAAIANHASTEGLKVFGTFIQNMGDFFFGNLPLLFAVTIAIAYAKQAGIAAFTAVVAYATFCGIQQAIILPEELKVVGGDSISLGTYSILFWSGIPGSVVGKSMGITSLQTSVFGGIIIGAVSAWTYNRFNQLKLPTVLGFFNGTRAVPIIVIALMAPVTILVAMIWPGIGLGLAGLGVGLGVLSSSGNIASFFFGYIERALVPTGLHHAFYSPLWFSQVGGDMYGPMTDTSMHPMIWHNGQAWYVRYEGVDFYNKSWGDLIKALAGKDIDPDKWVGDSKLWMAVNSICGKELELLDPVTKQATGVKYTTTFYTFAQWTFNKVPGAVKYIGTEQITAQLAKDASKFAPAFPGVNPGQYLQGKYSFMDYGLPAAAAAIIMAAPKENRKFASSIVGSAAFTSMLTGITEPIEFTFLFLSPALFWGVHAFFCALSFWLVTMFGAHIGMTFSGGLIDFVIYGILPDALGHRSNCWIAILLGLAYIPIYYFVFYFWIKHFNLQTPGRGGEKLYTKKDYLAREDAKKAASQTTGAASGQQNKVSVIQIKAYKYLQALGGKANVENANACITKLRPVVKDATLVDEAALKRCGALGISHAGNTYSIVIGTEAPLICQALIDIANGHIDEATLKSAAME